MVSYQAFLIINQRLNEIFDMKDDVLFGNLNIICFGDFFQLRSVMGYFIFHEPVISTPFHVWKDCLRLEELTMNMRQKDHKEYGDMCNRFRIGQQTTADIETLRTRMEPHVDLNYSHFSKALRVFPTIKQCEAYNFVRSQELGQMICIPALLMNCCLMLIHQLVLYQLMYPKNLFQMMTGNVQA